MNKLDALNDKVNKLYTSNNPDADPWINWGYTNHVLIVAKKAETIAHRYNGNKEFVVAGSLLHDIADTVMQRNNAVHEEESITIAKKLLDESGYTPEETEIITEKIIKPHSCREVLPDTVDGKIMATADSMAHLTTDFYLYFCWMHYGKNDYNGFKQWVLKKIERDFNIKIFFDEIKKEVEPNYNALTKLFSL
jgi:putative nucleotidyltransferase with HDIG domain